MNARAGNERGELVAPGVAADGAIENRGEGNVRLPRGAPQHRIAEAPALPARQPGYSPRGVGRASPRGRSEGADFREEPRDFLVLHKVHCAGGLLEAFQEAVVDMGNHVHQRIFDSVEGIHQGPPASRQN